jgi:hypothetical protein
MINSPKLAILMATMAVIGAGAIPMAPMALAQDEDSQSVEIERNNEIEQSIKQSQEACTNEAEVSVSDDDGIDIGGENEVSVEQSNECDVTQSQNAANVGSIVDNSENTFDISQFLLDIDVPNTDCAIRNGNFVCQ